MATFYVWPKNAGSCCHDDPHNCSDAFMPIGDNLFCWLQDLFSPHLKMFSNRDFNERGVNIDITVPVTNMEDTGYGMKTQSIDVISGVWVANMYMFWNFSDIFITKYTGCTFTLQPNHYFYSSGSEVLCSLLLFFKMRLIAVRLPHPYWQVETNYLVLYCLVWHTPLPVKKCSLSPFLTFFYSESNFKTAIYCWIPSIYCSVIIYGIINGTQSWRFKFPVCFYFQFYLKL